MTIVAAVDRSDRAERVLAGAADLAAGLGESVDVVHVVSPSKLADLNLESVDRTEGTVDVGTRAVGPDRLHEHAMDVAEAMAGDLEVPSTPVGLVGDPARRIVDYAAEVEASYVVVAPRRRSRAGKAVFGSVAQSVVLEAGCPVVAVTEP